MSANEHGAAPKAGMQHTLLLLALVAVFSFGFYTLVIPRGVEGAVLSLFHPHDEKENQSFKEVVPGVFAVMKDTTKPVPAGAENLKEYIKTDYIFDFSHAERSEAVAGYSKGAGEWVVKANGEGGLGEAAIILEPAQGFTILSLVLGFALAIFVTFFMPSSIGYMAQKVDREIHHTKTKIRLQTGFSDEIVDLLVMPDKQLMELEAHQVRSSFKVVWDRTMQDTDRNNGRRVVRFEDVFSNDVSLAEFRKEVLFIRIQEFFSDFVVNEIIDTTAGLVWSGNRGKFFGGLRLYMAHHFTEKYSNNVTGLAYFGAAILIVIIGIRGLKFIPATKPSLILAAISLEGSLLALLAFGLIYTGEEERVDKLMKKMEDAAKLQLETMKDVSQDMHQMASALVGETSEIIKKKVELAIADALASDDNVKRVVSDKVAEKIIVAMREAFPGKNTNS
jgi:polyhydroxyalkanoate synthesis regulator phasin